MNLIYRFDKKIRYASRKARADVRKRVKGRFIKAGEAYDYDPLSQTRSYWALNVTVVIVQCQPSNLQLLICCRLRYRQDHWRAQQSHASEPAIEIRKKRLRRVGWMKKTKRKMQTCRTPCGVDGMEHTYSFFSSSADEWVGWSFAVCASNRCNWCSSSSSTAACKDLRRLRCSAVSCQVVQSG